VTNFAYSSALNNLVGNTPGANVSSLVQCLNDLKTFLNSPNLDSTNIADIPESLLALAVQQKLGLNDGAQVGRGKSIIATEETITPGGVNTFMTTPDRVSNLVLTTDGLIFVALQAMWKESVNNSARALITLNGNDIVRANDRSPVGPTVTGGTALATTADTYKALVSFPGGLQGIAGDATAYTGDLTTGQLIGVMTNGSVLAGSGYFGFMTIFAAAGTYEVGLKFTTNTGGTVTAKNRKLWCWTMGF